MDILKIFPNKLPFGFVKILFITSSWSIKLYYKRPLNNRIIIDKTIYEISKNRKPPYVLKYDYDRPLL
jgi:hypothetical protein